MLIAIARTPCCCKLYICSFLSFCSPSLVPSLAKSPLYLPPFLLPSLFAYTFLPLSLCPSICTFSIFLFTTLSISTPLCIFLLLYSSVSPYHSSVFLCVRFSSHSTPLCPLTFLSTPLCPIPFLSTPLCLLPFPLYSFVPPFPPSLLL